MAPYCGESLHYPIFRSVRDTELRSTFIPFHCHLWSRAQQGLSPQSRVPLTNLQGRCLPSGLCSKDLWIICAQQQHRQLWARAHVRRDPHSPHLASLRAWSRWLRPSWGNITTPWRWGYLVLQSLRIKTGAGNRYGLKAKYIIPPVPVITRSRRFEMTV